VYENKKKKWRCSGDRSQNKKIKKEKQRKIAKKDEKNK